MQEAGPLHEMLCWWNKKDVDSSADLHKLHGIGMEATQDQAVCQGYLGGKAALFPEAFVFSDDGADFSLIQNRVLCKDVHAAVVSGFMVEDDIGLYTQSDLRIGHHYRQQQSMSPSAVITEDSLYGELDPFSTDPYSSLIRTIFNEASGMSAGATYSKKVQALHNLLIAFL